MFKHDPRGKHLIGASYRILMFKRDSRGKHLIGSASYRILMFKACTLTNETFNDSHQDQLDSCNQTKWQFILDSRVIMSQYPLTHNSSRNFLSLTISYRYFHFIAKTCLQKCHKLQAKSTNATEICECWDQAATDVEVNEDDILFTKQFSSI